jgi:hypothetical protein
MVCFGARLQLAQGFGVDTGMSHVQFEDEVMSKGVRSLHHNIKRLDAVDCDVPLGENLGLGVVEVYTDKNAELIGHVAMPS